MPIATLYRDDHLMVVHKPAGLLSVPGRDARYHDSLITRLQADYPEARTVHRLDCETSGVTVIALDRPTHRELSRQFHDREVSKTYLAVCAGRLTPEEGSVAYPIGPDYIDRPRQQIDYFYGKNALTHWHVLATESDRTRVQLTPVTGRSHQLRVHLWAMGHPILGDSLYAPPAVMALADRLLLHASELSFTHPQTQERVHFQASCPF